MANNDDSFYHVFPKGFIWGMANSAYQTEGGWKADGNYIKMLQLNFMTLKKVMSETCVC